MNVVVSEPFLCLAVCFEAVVHALSGISDLLSRYSFAERFGVVIPPGNQALQGVISNVKYSADCREWGIEADPPGVNALFRAQGVALTAEFESTAQHQDWSFEDQVTAFVQTRMAVIFCLDYGRLYGKTEWAGQGHAVIGFSSVRRDNDVFVSIMDPGPDRAGLYDVGIHDLYVATGRRHGGFWSLSPITF